MAQNRAAKSLLNQGHTQEEVNVSDDDKYEHPWCYTWDDIVDKINAELLRRCKSPDNHGKSDEVYLCKV